MIDQLFVGSILGIGAFLLLAFRRLAWWYAAVAAAGMALVFSLLPGWPGIPYGVAILLAAIGGGIASVAVERGERDRERRVAEILRGSSTSG
jgi:peptidoglycan/LPS O-acetylase OafA/YrhL